MSAHSPLPWALTQGYYKPPIVDANGDAVVSLGDDGACGDPECCGSPTYRIEVSQEDLELIVAAVNAYQLAR